MVLGGYNQQNSRLRSFNDLMWKKLGDTHHKRFFTPSADNHVMT